MNVAQLMTRDIVVAASSQGLGACARMMVSREVRHLPVTDASGRLCGMVSDHDIFRRGGLVGVEPQIWVGFDPDDDALGVGTIAGEPLRLTADEELDAALFAIQTARAEAAVVVNADDRPIGMITEHDGVRYAAQQLPSSILVYDDPVPRVVSVSRQDPARVALQHMRSHRIRHVLVLDEGRLHGVLSLRDLISDAVDERPEMTAEETLRRRGDVISIQPGTQLCDAARLMTRYKIGCLPIIGPTRVPLGVLTRFDVISALIVTLHASV